MGISLFYWITGVIFDRVLSTSTGYTTETYEMIALGGGTAIVGTLVLYDIFRPRKIETKSKDAMKGIRIYRNETELKTELPLQTLFSKAKSRINILAMDAGISVRAGREPLREALKRGVEVRFVLVDEEAEDLLTEVGRAWPLGGDASETLQEALTGLRTIKKEVPDGRLTVRFFKSLPIHSIIIIDDTFMQVTTYRYGTHSWTSLVFSEKDQPELFKAYIDSYKFVDDDSKTRPFSFSEEKTRGEALQFDIETNSDWAQVTYGSMLRREREPTYEIRLGATDNIDSKPDMFHINKRNSKGEITRMTIKGYFSVLARRPKIQLKNGADGNSKLTVYDLDSHRIVSEASTDSHIHELEVVLQLDT